MVARSAHVAMALLGLALVAPAFAGCVSPAATEPSKAGSLVVDQVPTGARLSWNEFPLGRALFFKVYKNGGPLVDVPAPTRTWLDDTVQPDLPVEYTVRGVMRDGTLGPRSELVDFTFKQTMALAQNEDHFVKRGYANLTIAAVTPGVRWDQLVVTVNGVALFRSDVAYTEHQESWTHSAPQDPYADLGERLNVYSPRVVRNATFDVKLGTGKVLVHQLLHGQPTMNLTLAQERNVTSGLASFAVRGLAWFDGARDVSSSYPTLVARWSAVEVRVNGTIVPYSPDGRPNTWTHDAPTDDVLRIGGRLSMRLAPNVITAGAIVVVRDAEANEESFRHTLK